MPRALDSGSYTALVARAGACPAPGQDLAPVGDMSLETPDILVIRGADLVGAEHADFAPRRVAAPTAYLWRPALARVHARRRRGAPAVIVATTPFITTRIFISHG